MLEEILNSSSILFIISAIVWSTYQGIRGAIEQNRIINLGNIKFDSCNQSKKANWTTSQKWIILYIHDFAFRFICTLSGFISLAIIKYTLNKTTNLDSINSVLITFLFLLSIIGIGGQLHYVIMLGRVPK